MLAAKAFYELLLASKVFVPLRVLPSKEESLFLKKGAGLEGFLLAEADSRKILPVFLNKEHVSTWAEIELPSREIEFPALLRLFDEKTWLHIDPGQEYGREFSPWDISKLQSGVEAIEEVIAEEFEQSSRENLEVSEDTSEFEKEILRLQVILESYPSVREARIIVVRKNSDRTPIPYLSLFMESRARMDELLGEINENFISSPYLCDDANLEGSPNSFLFENITPFYIRQEKSRG